jgi:hypothetical protein
MEYLLIMLIVLFSFLFSYIIFEVIALIMGNRVYGQGFRLIMKKTIFYILAVYIIFLSIKSLYSMYQSNKIYNEFKKIEIINSIDISTLKDNYILLEGKIKSEPNTFQDEYIEANDTFVYLDENKEHYWGKSGWKTDSTYKFYADSVSVCNIPIDLRTFDINNSEGIKEDDIKERYKKYYNQNLYFNKDNGSLDKRIVYKVLRNNDDVLIFLKVKDGKLVPLSNTDKSIIFTGGDNYNRLDSYLKDNAKQDTSLLGFMCFVILTLTLIIFRKNRSISKFVLKSKYKGK